MILRLFTFPFIFIGYALIIWVIPIGALLFIQGVIGIPYYLLQGDRNGYWKSIENISIILLPIVGTYLFIIDGSIRGSMRKDDSKYQV
jgi:hypothetical protein